MVITYTYVLSKGKVRVSIYTKRPYIDMMCTYRFVPSKGKERVSMHTNRLCIGVMFTYRYVYGCHGRVVDSRSRKRVRGSNTTERLSASSICGERRIL